MFRVLRDLVQEEADDVDVAGLGGEVERRVSLVVRQVVVDEGDVLQHLQHLDHPVAAEVARGRLEGEDQRRCLVPRGGWTVGIQDF